MPGNHAKGPVLVLMVGVLCLAHSASPSQACAAPADAVPPPVAPAAPAPADQVPPVEFVPQPQVRHSATFGDFVALKSQIEMKKLDLQLFELNKKMEKTPAKAPEVLPRQELNLPAFTMPPVEPKPAPAPVLSDVVLSVHGMDGKLSAVMRTSAGRQVNVKVGDKFGGGVVSGISRNGVVIRRGNSLSTILFDEQSHANSIR